MLHANGTSYHPGRQPDPALARRATPAQRRLATYYASAPLGGLSHAALAKAAQLLAQHPDVAASGYSSAKNAFQRVQAEQAARHQQLLGSVSNP